MAEPASSSQANAEENVQGFITRSNRAPHAKDKGLFWVERTASVFKFYGRNDVTGAWVLIGP